MMHTAADIKQSIRSRPVDPTFPDAPEDWSPVDARAAADADALHLTDAHWDVVRALQHYFARHADVASINMRDLHDALDEHFHAIGGLRTLYRLFPGGPIAQGCRIAGLRAPFLATDASFGSVA